MIRGKHKLPVHESLTKVNKHAENRCLDVFFGTLVQFNGQGRSELKKGQTLNAASHRIDCLRYPYTLPAIPHQEFEISLLQ